MTGAWGAGLDRIRLVGAVVEREVREEQTALPSREVALVEDNAVVLGGNPPRENDFQSEPPCRLAEILPRS